jgi:hypothetical protein
MRPVIFSLNDPAATLGGRVSGLVARGDSGSSCEISSRDSPFRPHSSSDSTEPIGRKSSMPTCARRCIRSEQLSADWVQRDNEARPHDALAGLPPPRIGPTLKLDVLLRPVLSTGGLQYDLRFRKGISGESSTLRIPATGTTILPIHQGHSRASTLHPVALDVRGVRWNGDTFGYTFSGYPRSFVGSWG